MNFHIAKRTIEAIDKAIESDQGASFRKNLQLVLPHMADAYRGEDENPFRSHLGASVIGGECARQIWYGFRWTTVPKFTSRILRLFNRGHLEEGRFIAQLLTIGCEVIQQDANGKQFRISDVGGHFGGSGDGVALNVPDVADGYACLLEFKTHNDKSFKKLKAEGVRHAKFEHFVQMQTYMRKMGIVYGLYGAVNKNDDECHWEIVILDTAIADQFIQRGREIILMKTEPKRISESPGWFAYSWFACSWCDHKAVCHQQKRPSRNCRTCLHAVPEEDGKWYCNLDAFNKKVLSEQEQQSACELYSPFSGK